ERKYQTVLNVLLEGKRIDAQYDPVQRYELATAFQVTQTLARLVPDRDAESLRALDAFCKDLLEHTRATAELAVGSVRLGVPMTSTIYPRELELYRARLLA